jgi:glycosyltransferase involved in cell wall biosynthesis
LNGKRNVLLWLNPQDAVHMVGRMGESRVIYDITDDWTQFTHFTERKGLLARTIAEDAELCRRADSVIVCSKSLYESRKALSRDIRLIPNGVDAAHYRCVLDDHGPLPEACRNWPRPVFGYTGSIHADRVDVNLLEAMTAAMKERNIPGTIVLIGPVMLPAEQQRRLEATGRVIFTGPMAYRDLPKYMRAFDVCIVPHCMTAFVESLNPIKLWEYLAGGKPIVSTDVAGFRDYPALVRMARSADEFLTQCEAAVLEGNSKSALRRAEAAKHSWRSRVDEIVTVLCR